MVSDRPLRVVYFGTPEFAVPALRHLLVSRHIVDAVISQPDRPKGRGHRLVPTPTKVVAAAAGVTVLQPERLRDEMFLRDVAALAPDLGVVAAYGKLLPDALLRIPKFGMINVHASLLPAWRGAAPVHRAVIAGDVETGVTIMRMVRELDAGPVFASVRRRIGPDETSADVERGLAEMGADLLLSVIEQIASGDAVETPQDDSKATYAPKISRAEGSIAWSLPAERLHNLVRGLQPWPLVTARLGGARVLVHRTALTNQATEAPVATIAHAEGDYLAVAAGDGELIRILRIQPDGRRVMSAREFLAGHPVRIGTSIEPA